MWEVYMVRCRTGEFYTGCTTDIKRRVKQHNRGSGSRFTRSRRPVVLVYHEPCSTKSSALKRENQIKRMTRLQKMALVQTASTTIE